MKHLTRPPRNIAALSAGAILCLSLAACGGGGGGSTGGTSGTGPTSTSYSLTVTGLASGQSATLMDGTQPIPITANGPVDLQSVQPTDAVSIAQQPGSQTCELVFGSTASTSTTVAQLESTTGAEVDCSTYPAATPSLPQAGVQTGITTPDVIANPIVTPVFFSNDPTAAQGQESTFLSALVASKLWSTLAQYGVGKATVAAPIVLSTAAGSSFLNSTAQSLLSANAAAWSGGALDTNRFFIFYLPNGTKLADNPTANAYHSVADLGPSATPISYAVVPLPSDYTQQQATEHELMEGSADVGAHGYSTVPDQWGAVYTTGMELADLCQPQTAATVTAMQTTESDLAGYVLQPIWSNAAAASFQNPCVPDATASDNAVFGATPASPVTLSGYIGAVADTFAQGAIINPGASVTIPMRLFATSPNVGMMQLSASMIKGYSNATSPDLSGWTFTFDHSSQGINGDTVNLTVTAPADAGTGVYFAVVTVKNSNGYTYEWPLSLASSTSFN